MEACFVMAKRQKLICSRRRCLDPTTWDCQKRFKSRVFL